MKAKWWTALVWSVGTLLWEKGLISDVLLHRANWWICMDALWLALSIHGAWWNIMHIQGRYDLRSGSKYRRGPGI